MIDLIINFIFWPLNIFVSLIAYGAMGMIIFMLISLFVVHFILKRFVRNMRD
jgi:hypothetical protein